MRAITRNGQRLNDVPDWRRIQLSCGKLKNSNELTSVPRALEFDLARWIGVDLRFEDSPRRQVCGAPRPAPIARAFRRRESVFVHNEEGKMRTTLQVALIGCVAVAISAHAALGAGGVTVKGSDTMVILGQKWAEIYMQQNPDVKIQVTGGGSGTGIAALINGTTDIAEASRPMKSSETTSAEAGGGGKLKEQPVALDALTIYVSADNPLTEISLPQVRKVFTGQTTNWKEIGGYDAPINLYSRENNSGTYVFFKEHVLQNDDFDPSAQTLPGTAAVVNAVAKDANGIGYGGIAYAAGIKLLKVKKDDLSPAVEGTLENAQSGRYGLARELYFYFFPGKNPAADTFAKWTITPDGQKVVTDVGYYPLK
jgi:phosphate transport system substrate-binding protein